MSIHVTGETLAAPCTMRYCLESVLTFQTSTSNSLNNLFLEEHERDEQRQSTQHSRGHDLSVMNAISAVLNLVNALPRRILQIVEIVRDMDYSK